MFELHTVRREFTVFGLDVRHLKREYTRRSDWITWSLTGENCEPVFVLKRDRIEMRNLELNLQA
jgi:hypothetical protein